MQLPGEPIVLPLDPRETRGYLALFIGIWAFVAVLFAWSVVGMMAEGRPIAGASTIFLAMTTLTAYSVLLLVRKHRHAAALVFTSEGVWRPTRGGGEFIHWTEVLGARLAGSGRGATDLLLETPRGHVKIFAPAFADPYGLSRFVRERVGEDRAGSLPTSGEI